MLSTVAAHAAGPIARTTAMFLIGKKALRAVIPVLAGVVVPSSLTVASGERASMALIGFPRIGRFHVYTGTHRILGLELPR